MRERTDSLATFESLNFFTDPSYKVWADIRMDRWLVDYMLRSGRFSSATKHSHNKRMNVCPTFRAIISEFQRSRTVTCRYPSIYRDTSSYLGTATA